MVYMDPLDPRMVVPFSDHEIVELHQRATAARKAADLEAHPYLRDPAADQEHWEFMFFLADFGIFVALVLFAVNAIKNELPAQIPTVAVCMCAIPILFFFLSRRYERSAIGPLGYIDLCRRGATRKPVAIDPNSPAVLATVIEYISETPIARSEALRTEIKHHRAQLGYTLENLPALVESFEREIRVAENEELLLILQSRRDAAKEALDRLRQVDENLESQYEEAELAVQPLLKMRNQFARYRELSESLSRIQAAYDLVAEGEEKVRDNRLELRALYASSMSAQAKLAEIQSMMDATELAREEVRQLMA
jgi:hypothetical protein